MAKRVSTPPPPALRLRIAPEDARSRLAGRIELGKGLKDIPVTSWESLDLAQKEYEKWNDYNKEMLRQMFTNDEPSAEYGRYAGGVVFLNRDRSLGREHNELRGEISEKLHRLESLSNRLELIPLSDEVADRVERPSVSPGSSTKVFVVHGHDEAIRESVARFLEKLDLDPVILHEKPNEGMTVIEKLEHHADVRFAVVLLTPDDEGRSVAEDGATLKLRARQNVVLELGYARQLHDQSDLPAGTFETMFSFAQVLTESAKLAKTVSWSCLCQRLIPVARREHRDDARRSPLFRDRRA